MSGLAEYRRTLVANGKTIIAARGTTIVLRDCTGPVKLSMRQNQLGLKEGQTYTLTLRRGEKWFAAEEFDSVQLEDAAGIAQSVALLIGYGDYVMPPINIAVGDIFRSYADVDVADEVPVQVAPANLTRKKIIIRSKHDNPDVAVRLKGSAGDADGVNLIPGAAIELEVRGEIWAQVSDDTDPVLLEVSEELNNA